MLSELLADLREGDDRPAMRGVSRGDLGRLVSGYAAALHANGLVAGDTIGLAVRPGPRALGAMLAAYRMGLRIAVLDPSAGPDVLLARLTTAQPRLVLADAAAQAVAGWAAPLARRAHLALPDLSAIAPLRTLGRRLPGTAPTLSLAGGPAPASFDGDGDAVIVFTSGTTSRPRAVVHTRAGLSAGMRTVHDLVRPVPGRPVLGGTFFVLLPSLAAGAPVALPARRPRALARQIRRLGPQATYLTPPQLRAALARGVRFTGRVYSGSAPVSASLLRAVRAAGADEAWGVYALTELFPAAAVESADKAAFTSDGDLVGALLPGVSARLHPPGFPPPADALFPGDATRTTGGPLAGQDASRTDRLLPDHDAFSAGGPSPGDAARTTGGPPAGHDALSAGGLLSGGAGELFLSGPNAADRYLGEDPFEWVATGDIARIVGGRVVLGGRRKDMILRGAENIYPGLYEPSLHVLGVWLAVVVGTPAQDGDERVVALIQPAPGADPAQIRAALRDPLSRMGTARPDSVILTEIPLSGRSRKPDRAAAARLAATLTAPGPPTDLDRLYRGRTR
ncbi:AMP-binding protein [Actinoplanes sp. NPDC049265]|uniref:AMP-binding protein n=1 Tax=Actinoplanes sp. NPDC049265 TaxID=3363902 RepID=UPI00371E3597